jgi:acyl dehydratase
MHMSAKIYWEDFFVGRVFDLGTREVTREEIIEFARNYDPQPFHIDEVAAKQSIYGGLIASGLHTCAMLNRMMVDGMARNAVSMGSPGIDNLRWLKPVRPGDTLRAQIVIMETRASTSKPDRGVIKTKSEVFNQKNELVMTMEAVGMYGRRPGA